ncbi:MAG TPA: SOS response-associated peptidase family protein, partial [Pirellulales bacterium]
MATADAVQRIAHANDSCGSSNRQGPRISRNALGLVPPWESDPGKGYINAKSETVAEKRTFKTALQKRRCLIPADGFFEWKKIPTGKSIMERLKDAENGIESKGSRKQPYFFHR